MDERRIPGDRREHDADEALARDDSSWFARQLGDGWEPEEPGIYQFVGRPPSLDPSEDGLERERQEPALQDEAQRRWPPWRRS